jgi:hypothetical protein
MNRSYLRLVVAVIVFLLWLIANAVLFQTTLLNGLGLRYLLAPPLVLTLFLLMSAKYIHAVYDLSSWSKAFQYFLACMFGIHYPVLVVNEGKPVIEGNEENLILKIGGPGFLYIHNGSAAVIENYKGKIRVLGPGRHRLSRDEIFKDCISLETRFQPIEKLSTRSKDGIEVVIRDICYRFRVYNPTGSETGFGQFSKALHEYSDESILRIVYSRAQTANGTGSWEDEVRKTVQLMICEFIQQHQVDYLVAPKTEEHDPRAEIYNLFSSPGGIKRFQDKGAELVWIDIGHFETPEEDVSAQRVTTWRARWLGNENLVRDYGDAQAIGKAEAQANVLMKVVESLEITSPPGNKNYVARSRYLDRIAQLLETMIDQSPP